jgi:hypothetical protein
MAAESWMFEKSWDEFMILHFRYVLLFQCPFPCPHPDGVHHLLLLETLAQGHSVHLVGVLVQITASGIHCTGIFWNNILFTACVHKQVTNVYVHNLWKYIHYSDIYLFVCRGLDSFFLCFSILQFILVMAGTVF